MPIEKLFPDKFLGVSFASMFLCVMLPTLYYIFQLYKRRINHAAFLAGIAASIVFGMLLVGILHGNVVPASAADRMGNFAFSALRGICVGVADGLGIYLTMLFLSRSYEGIKIPVSVGLGYSLFRMILTGGIAAFSNFSLAMAVNENGVDAMLESVEITQVDKLREQIQTLTELPLDKLILSASGFACFFILCISLSRIMWYAINGGRLESSKSLIPIAVILGALAEAANIYASRVENYLVPICIYYLITLAALGLSIWLRLKRDDAQKVSAGALNRKLL